MKNYIYTAQNVDEAIKKGLKDLGLSEEEVKIEVTEAGSTGFLGLFKKEATVKLIPLDENFEKQEKTIEIEKEEVKEEKLEVKIEEIKEEQEETSSEQNEQKQEKVEEKEKKEDRIVVNKDKIVNYLEKIVHSMGFDSANIEFEEEGNKNYRLRIVNVENSSLLIGKRGNTLNSLQVLIENYAKRFTKFYFKIHVDCDEYRDNRKETLEELAINMAKKSKKLGKPIELEPMTSAERKIIHNALKDIKNVETESKGVEPHRYLVITAK